MKLYIHFGIYKAGSSFIQTACALNRSYLQEQGIWFPMSPHQKRMEEGIISPGNAGDLSKLLSNADEGACSNLITKWKIEAEAAGCDKVLISAESLVHQLAKKEALSLLQTAAVKAGFTTIYALGFFRDLADHALSTYKHRAKSGRIPDFKLWLETVYETPALLKSLFANYRTTNIEWSFRKFEKSSAVLLKTFFNDWLKIELPPVKAPVSVNESVTLSEVVLMKHIATTYKSVSDFFVNALKEIPKSEKGDDRYLEMLYYNEAYHTLKQYEGDLMEINAWFPDGEKLSVGNYAELSTKKSELVFSEKQIGAVVRTVGFFGTSKGKWIRIRRFIVGFVK